MNAWHPLTADRWEDFTRLFGTRGAYGGCWCMWWRITRAQFNRDAGDRNRAAMHEIVQAGVTPGILLYEAAAPIGWCSVAPRRQFGALNRSPILKPVDDLEVWSLVCFYVGRDHRGSGTMEKLIRGAIDHVRQNGGAVLEAYPTVPRRGELPPVSSFMGIPSVFERLGFVEVARPSEARVIMRYYLDR